MEACAISYGAGGADDGTIRRVHGTRGRLSGHASKCGTRSIIVSSMRSNAIGHDRGGNKLTQPFWPMAQREQVSPTILARPFWATGRNGLGHLGPLLLKSFFYQPNLALCGLWVKIKFCILYFKSLHFVFICKKI